MKKTYLRPITERIDVKTVSIICCSIDGVEGTASLKTSVSNDETDEYLSRRSHSIWDDED